MSAEANRVPAGVPTGGQFSATQRAASNLSLVAPAPERTFSVLADWEPDTDVTYPQANDLEKVVAVADVVDGGATTPDAIAEALDMHHRQGGYYANAAAYMGLIEADRGEACTSYSNTNLGQAFVNSDPSDRAEMIAQMVAALDDANLVATEGSEALALQLQKDGYSPDTAQRRGDCMKSWVAATDDRTGLSLSIGAASESTRNRIESAAQMAKTQRDNARAAAVPTPTYTLCPSCFMALPATGICDDCA